MCPRKIDGLSWQKRFSRPPRLCGSYRWDRGCGARLSSGKKGIRSGKKINSKERTFILARILKNAE